MTDDQTLTVDNFASGATFKVRLTMLSDWHVGTGAGRPGNVDRLLARDADDFPFVPAKTLNGIWRDAAERLAYGLDNKVEGGAWAKWVDFVFGSQPNQVAAEDIQKLIDEDELTPRESSLQTAPARLSENLRRRIIAARDRRLFEALTFIKPGIEIEESSGTSRQDFLRFEEMGRAGTMLEAACELRIADAQAEDSDTHEAQQKGKDDSAKLAAALLVVSAKLVERIGGKRRRGAGECCLEILDASGNAIDVEKAVGFLRSKKGAAPPVPARRAAEHSPDTAQSVQEKTGEDATKRQDGEWVRVGFSLRLLTPVSIVTAVLGNVSESLDFVPGTYLLPHITKCFDGQLQNRIQNAVANGEFQVSSATIEINKQRGLPVPRAIAYHKLGGGFDEPNTIYNRFEERIEAKTENAQLTQVKLYRAGYVGGFGLMINHQGKLPTYAVPTKTVLMHNTIEDEYQRPTPDVGGIFSREAVAANTRLRGEIRLTRELAQAIEAEHGTAWQEKIAGRIRLGTSRKDDYGLAELKVKPPQTITETTALASDHRLTICFLSDALLRNETLRPTYNIQDLSSLLAAQLQLDESQGEKLEVAAAKDGCLSTMIQTRRIESWHEGWSFPRPSLVAIAAGSCAVFQITVLAEERKREITRRLNQLERSGIGERRGEGYGEISFNSPLLTRKINDWQPADKLREVESDGDENAPLNDEETKAARMIERAAWREELRVAVLKVADSRECRQKIFGFEIEGTGDNKKSYPPMSQIGGLRSAISRLQKAGDKKFVVEWLEHLKSTGNRLDRWQNPKSDFKAEDKIDAINMLISSETEVWEVMGDKWHQPPTIASTTEELQKEFRAEAVRSLFGACAHAHKRALES